MVKCANCGQRLPEDPNELDEITECRYCKALLCSSQCASDHEERAHAAEAVPMAEDEDERR
jgi:hypothetical protein